MRKIRSGCARLRGARARAAGLLLGLLAADAGADPPAWKDVAAEVADRERSPQYGGLALEPQRDLVPLRRDPASGLWEFLLKETGTAPRLPAGEPLALDDTTGIVLILVPAGATRLGTMSPPGRGDEHPPRTVELDAFYVAKYEVTQGQWKRIAGSNPSEFAAGKVFGGRRMTLRHPVEQVTWDECRRQLKKVDLLLPTEAQWERAARAGTETEWSFGADEGELVRFGNVRDQAAAEQGGPFEPAKWNDGFPFTAPVGFHRPNPFGLYDVHGNVWEWCEDGYRADAYSKLEPRPKDGLMESQGPANRSIRSGSYWAPVIDSRSAERTGIPPGTRARGVGVRPVRPAAAVN